MLMSLLKTNRPASGADQLAGEHMVHRILTQLRTTMSSDVRSLNNLRDAALELVEVWQGVLGPAAPSWRPLAYIRRNEGYLE